MRGQGLASVQFTVCKSPEPPRLPARFAGGSREDRVATGGTAVWGVGVKPLLEFLLECPAFCHPFASLALRAQTPWNPHGYLLTSNFKQCSESRMNQILSLARLPFRHVGFLCNQEVFYALCQSER